MGAAMRKVEGWGWIGVGTTEKGVARVVLPKSSKKAVEEALRDFRNGVNQSLAENCLQAISRYLKGEPVNFERIPIDWDFVPPVHRSILLTLRKTVPLGKQSLTANLPDAVGCQERRDWSGKQWLKTLSQSSCLVTELSVPMAL
jgi:hypothetical protein